MWEKNFASVEHINDYRRMENLYEKLIAEAVDINDGGEGGDKLIFCVCHWGVIQNYVNRFCENLERNSDISDHASYLPAADGWDFSMTPFENRVLIEDLENCCVRVIDHFVPV